MEQAVDAMWPDTEPGRERERFWTALGNLRSVLRKATAITELKAVQRDGLRYRVDQELFAVDLWWFQAALAAARRADLDVAVAGALAEAGDVYGGPLLDGTPLCLGGGTQRGPPPAGGRRPGPPRRAMPGRR